MVDTKLISIICPVYNEEASIPAFYERITAVMRSMEEKYNFELIFTNNRSVDRTLTIIMQLHEQNSNVKLLTLSRNFGYQASVLAGLTFASGDATIVIDVDCEDPPELLFEFVQHWEQGYDIVYGIRKKRSEIQSLQALRNVFYWLLKKMGDNDVILNMAEFALISRPVREAALQNKTTFPFLRTEISYVGFERLGIPYARQPRQFGKTHYNFWGMAAFAIGGILTSSTFLLRISAFVGGALLLLNVVLFLLEIFSLVEKAFEVLVMLDLMYLVFYLAVLSVYTARIYKNGVQRPVFIVDWNLSTYPKPSSLEMNTSSGNAL